MRRTSTLSILLLFFVPSFSQTFQLALNSGIGNYCGDIQQKVFTFQKARPAVGIGVQYNLNGKLALRGEYSVGSLTASDKNNKRIDLRERNLSFSTALSEASLMIEYNLLNLENFPLTPYFFAGVAAFHFNPFSHTVEGEKIYLRELSTEGQGLAQYPDRKVYDKTQVSIPYGGGIKYALSNNVHLGVELGLRKLFTDYLDDVSAKYVDGEILLKERGTLSYQYSYRGDELSSAQATEGGYPDYGYIRGDPKQNDSYYFAQVRLLIKMNWMSKNNYESPIVKRRNRTGCPSNVL